MIGGTTRMMMTRATSVRMALPSDEKSEETSTSTRFCRPRGGGRIGSSSVRT
jgi:hypothetical protein